MNFSELVALITDDLVDERLSTAQIQSAINSAIRFYSRKTFFFNTLRTSFPTVDGQAYYSLVNSNSLGVDYLYNIMALTFNYTSNSVEQVKELTHVLDLDIEKIYRSGDSYKGVPDKYSYTELQIRLHPTPNIVGTCYVLATTKLDPLAEDTDSNVFLEYAEELIRQSAKRYLSFNTLHDATLGERCAAMEGEELASLEAETRKRKPIYMAYVPADLNIIATPSNTAYDIINDR